MAVAQTCALSMSAESPFAEHLQSLPDASDFPSAVGGPRASRSPSPSICARGAPQVSDYHGQEKDRQREDGAPTFIWRSKEVCVSCSDHHHDDAARTESCKLWDQKKYGRCNLQDAHDEAKLIKIAPLGEELKPGLCARELRNACPEEECSQQH